MDKHMTFAIFSNQDSASTAVSRLQEKGYETKDISLVLKQDGKTNVKAGNEVGQDAGTGAKVGAIVGALAGILTAIGVIALPGGLFIGGPLLLALGITGGVATTVGGAALGALAGGLVGALVGLGVPETQAVQYQEHINNGGVLVVVTSDSTREVDAKAILQEAGGEQITEI